jgi:Fe-S cluster assembly protein SufD
MSRPGEDVLDRLLPGGLTAEGPAADWLREHGLPSRRDEAWRYTALDDIVAGDWERPALTADDLPDRAVLDAVAGHHGGTRLVLADGLFVPDLSDLGAVPEGVSCTAERLVPPPPRPRYDGFQAVNDLAAAVGQTAVVRVTAASRPDATVHLVHLDLGGDAPSASYPRTVVEVGGGGCLTLIESYAGTPGRRFIDATTTITVADEAELNHHRILTGPEGGFHVGHTLVEQAAGSRVQSWSLLAGAETARNAIDVILHGDDAVVDIGGLYLASGTQRHDTAVTVEHAASGGTSRQHVRGVVADRARGSFNGHVIVAAHTRGTDAGQTSRSLLLSPTAEADTRPWLEIFADDVRCTHGATVGRLDDDALFYLRSRGIPEPDARAMLVDGFVAEATEAIESASLRSFVGTVIADAAGSRPR